ncbi:unnamed protein product [Caenorhabditis sp. 36 PRJEB53466]|nr:unnamed protein product [Caenorhabditis sp. 36 PRJEB53466]
MSSDIMSESTCIEPMEPAKSVTKVQRLCNVAFWNDDTSMLKDYVKCFFSKRTPVFRLKHEMTTRKRVLILTPGDSLLVYETNCTGYLFDISRALKLKISCNRFNNDEVEKSCTVTLKYKFGEVNIVLVNDQISVWRRTLSTVFEGECFDRTLLTDISLYTAKDEDLEDYCGNSVFDYTDSAISLKSAHGCVDLSSQKSLALDDTQIDVIDSDQTNSNRSLTYAPTSVRSSRASLASVRPPNKTISSRDPISIRRGSQCVSYLAKKFEEKLGSIGRKMGVESQKKEAQQKTPSPPLEILFPPLPIQKVKEEDLKSLKEDKGTQVSKLDFTPSKKGKQPQREEIIIEE